MRIVTALLAVEDPSQSISPIFPETKEIIWGGLSFLIILGLLIKFAGPPIKKGLADRTARIQGELDRSSQARAQAEVEAAEIRSALGDVEAERERLLAEADTEAEALLVEGRARLEEEIIELRTKHAIELQSAGGRLNEEVMAEVGVVSVEAIETAVRASLDDSTQQRLIEEFITKVGASR
jgi:F-type H+-transporting ATPase subunit b